MRCNICVQILLSLCVSCHSCPHADEGIPSSTRDGKPITTPASPLFSRSELDIFLAYWEELAKAPPAQRIFKEKELAKQGKLPLERIEAMEAWAMRWSAHCAVPLSSKALSPEALSKILETKAVCWEELGRISGEEAGRWLHEHHQRLMELWEGWLSL